MLKLPIAAKWLLLLLTMKMLMKLVAQTACQDRQDVSTKSCFFLHDAAVDDGDLLHLSAAKNTR